MITEERIREALRDATARVDVDEDLAWQRAWLEIARQPIHRIRRTSIALAVAASVAVSVLAWQLFDGDRSTPSVTSGDPPVSAATEVPTTIFDSLRPNDDVDPVAWVAAANALASARGNVAGTVGVETRATGGQSASQRIAFSVDGQGQYAVDDSLFATYGYGGAEVQIDERSREIRIDASSRPAGGQEPVISRTEVALSNQTVDRVLRPGAWIASELTDQEMTITYLGRAESNGRPVDRFRVRFSSRAKYAAPGWDLVLDSRSGVLLGYVVYFAGGGATSSESVSVVDFTDAAEALHVQDEMLPGGYRVEALVGAGAEAKLVDAVVPEGGATVAAVLEQVRSAAQ